MFEAQKLYRAFLNEIQSSTSLWNSKPEEFVTGRIILERTPEQTISFILVVVKENTRYFYPLVLLLSQLARRSLPYTCKDIQTLLSSMLRLQNPYSFPMQALLRSVARALLDPEILNSCRPLLEQLREQTYRWYSSTDQRKFLRLLDDLLNGQVEPLIPLYADEWSKPLLASLDEMEEETRTAWIALLRFCATTNGTEPKSKWRTSLPPLLVDLGLENFYPLVTQWVGALANNKGGRLQEENAVVLKGLAWCCAGHPSLSATLADAAIEGYRKLPGIGPRSAMLAGACLYALKTMPDLSSVAQIERIRLNVRQVSYLKLIERALNEVAQRTEMSREDLEELTVPTFDLVNGRFQRTFGLERVEVVLERLTAQIQWLDSSGNFRQNPSAITKFGYKNEIKELKKLCADISHMLIAQRDRLEHLPLSERTWPFLVWRERYLEHPLISHLATHLLWRFSFNGLTKDAIWSDGRFVDAHDQPVGIPETARVSSWHPIFSNTNEILAWRNWLDQHQIMQPFKQVYREIYLLTDAERNTRNYSNRFAAHILKQHQFHALTNARGWQNTLRLMVDDSYPPASLSLPRWKLRAEFWIEGAGDEYGIDTNATGTYLHIATDQVRFYPLEAATNLAHADGGGYDANTWHNPTVITEPLPLTEIPAVVFSEVMRDVDLFVGVASIGNDPTWVDGGHTGHYHNYWQSYSFGDLSATAKTRRILLERLIPRLSIAERCTLEERFLKVRGELRTYKIHLGSGNILMEPDDQYLCIVPGRSTSGQTGTIFLPFEGDSVFSIILSKALLLAEDTKITDPSIIHQIRL